jgi:hypothetical protein
MNMIWSLQRAFGTYFQVFILYHFFHYPIIINVFNYISSRANEMKVKLLNRRKEHPIDNDELEYPNTPGIYVNKKINKEEDFNFHVSSNIINAIELSSSENWAGYKELFIETEKEYILFSE